MSKCGRKKYIKTNLRQMTMEIDSQQDGSIPDSVAESESAHMQMQTGQNSIPTLAQVSVAGSGTGRGSPAVTLVQLPSGQTVHVQGVFQTPQPSVIQSPQLQTVQVATIAETDESAESESVIDFHKRREILSRRPSYRKILNELSSDVPGVPKIEEEKSEEEGTSPNIAAMAVPTSIYQTSTGQYNEETELAPSHISATTGDMPTYQIRAPTTALPQGVVMAASPGSLHSPQQLAEEATRKRELRLMKNRNSTWGCGPIVSVTENLAGHCDHGTCALRKHHLQRMPGELLCSAVVPAVLG
ncbi:cAMP-responsive element modulator isoform X14 [Orcinus orca]|uniref:cAMP-responsive element modulator isoform X10 n=1 Tax=Sagmatias obliquidens TaxID=3371155 RepID=UPI000F44216D|nr:cAMP-responsive element modulator isoform X10 [Lagenorhynchus obliquidens]XP_030692898.1 cAMP-responsive element modulator isoform X10 [Globicephala melas]XP_049562127.1 cAMP-responsive element modulator isoform X14 [Orcinus orca]XP_060016820.1 cAMP-responsive element modulator isoform X13 [Lagenorhynchus albirostris]